MHPIANLHMPHVTSDWIRSDQSTVKTLYILDSNSDQSDVERSHREQLSLHCWEGTENQEQLQPEEYQYYKLTQDDSEDDANDDADADANASATAD